MDRFYGKVRVDALLGPILNDVAQVGCPTDIATLYSPDAARHRHPSRRALLQACRARGGEAHFAARKPRRPKDRALSIADTSARRMGLLPQGTVLLQP